jgi:hypothetical protein
MVPRDDSERRPLRVKTMSSCPDESRYSSFSWESPDQGKIKRTVWREHLLLVTYGVLPGNKVIQAAFPNLRNSYLHGEFKRVSQASILSPPPTGAICCKPERWAGLGRFRPTGMQILEKYEVCVCWRYGADEWKLSHIWFGSLVAIMVHGVRTWLYI